MNIFTLAKKAVFSFRNNGIKATFRKVIYSLSGNKVKPVKADHEELKKQRCRIFEYSPKISVLVPVCNTPDKFLRRMISSVQKQTYGNWELCLADGSDKGHASAEKTVSAFCETDNRIIYKKTEQSRSISENLNTCIDMATGEYIALLGQSDILHPSAFYYVAEKINDEKADFIYTDESTFRNSPKDAYFHHFKPDYSPDTLRSYNYIGNLSVFRKKLLDSVGKFRRECDGSQDYDMILRLTEKAEKTAHIPLSLYYRRSDKNSASCTAAAAHKALTDHLHRLGLKGTVKDNSVASTYKIEYDIPEKKKVSILIPNKDHTDDLKKCIDSVVAKTTYPDWEIIVIENNSTEKETFDYYEKIQKDCRIKVVTYIPEKPGFNYSSINNFGEKQASGDYLILLNNDIEILTPGWIEEMLMFCQRSDVGAAGMMLYYPDDTVQHAGVILGIGGVAGHSHKYFPRGDRGYASRLSTAQNLSAVTAACMMVRRDVFRAVGGFDTKLAVAVNDVDLCMKIRAAGYLIVFTPYAEAYHYESKSRGGENTPEKIKRFNDEAAIFLGKWHSSIKKGDPYYNPNLTLIKEDFGYKKAIEKSSVK